MENLLLTLVVISLIALIVAVLIYIGTRIQKILKERHLIFHWDKLFIGLISIVAVVYIIYSMVGMTIAPEYTKPNGNVCKGYKYGIQVCSGNINVE